MGKILNAAIELATKIHADQFRKGTQIPYILHPLETAAIVGTMTTDDEIIAGAVLHDAVEDTDTTIEQVELLFGERVAKLVAAESEDKRENLSAESTWKIRKQETLEHLKTASLEVKMITLGDKLSNIRAINRDYNSIGDSLWQRFNQKDKNEHYWYYQSIADCLVELNEYPVYREYCELPECIDDGNQGLVEYNPQVGGQPNPFENDVQTEIKEHPVEEYITEGGYRPGEGIHF